MTQRRSPLTLSYIIERIAEICPARHRELIRGMVAELASITDPAERRRFALGAIAAITRLAVRGYCQTIAHALGLFVGVREPEYRSIVGGLPMQKISSPQLLRRHAIPFAVSFASLTLLLLLASQAARLALMMSANGEPVGTIVEVLLLAVGSILPLTLPLAVFLTVLWVFTRLGAEEVLVPALRVRHGIRRLIFPVLGAASVIATLAFVSSTQIIPHTNARLTAVRLGVPMLSREERINGFEYWMTIGELREAASGMRQAVGEWRKDPRANAETGSATIAHAVRFEVAIQKRFALAASCLVLALAGAAMAIRFPRGGVRLVLGAGVVVIAGYYFSMVAGESLADRQVLSPIVAMWMANALLLAVALLLVWRPGRSDHTAGDGSLVIEG